MTETEAQTEVAKPVRRKRTMGEVLRSLGQPKVAVMLALGFAAGLPFMLIGNTLGYWMREESIDLKVIGFASWVGLFYSVKFLWAPIMDRVTLPLLGRRRGWMLLAQLGIAAGLAGMAMLGPHTAGFFLLAGLVAFSSASQDIVVDAWRIEIAETPDELGLLTAAYQLGYRAALLMTEAVILFMAEKMGWSWSYAAFAVIIGVGIIATLCAREPDARSVMADKASLWTPRGFYDAVAGPFIDFFRAHGAFAAVMLLMITFYHLSDYMRGPVSNPYYHDLGIPKPTVGAVRATIGLWATIIGIGLGGLSGVRFGYFRTLIIGAVLQPVFIAAFALLAVYGPNTALFTTIMAGDAFSIGFSGVALVAYMSSLTSLGYTASQYAVMTSALAWTGKTLKGFSGAIVESLQTSFGPLGGYAAFYLGVAALGLPAIVLCVVLANRVRRQALAVSPA